MLANNSPCWLSIKQGDSWSTPKRYNSYALALKASKNAVDYIISTTREQVSLIIKSKLK